LQARDADSYSTMQCPEQQPQNPALQALCMNTMHGMPDALQPRLHKLQNAVGAGLRDASVPHSALLCKLS